MKLGSNAQSATSYILINFEPYKAISARDIEPNSLQFKKIITNSFTGENDSFLEFNWTRFNISGANCFARLKIDQDVARGTLSITAKFHSYNHKGWGENQNFFLFPLYLATSQTLMISSSSKLIGE